MFNLKPTDKATSLINFIMSELRWNDIQLTPYRGKPYLVVTVAHSGERKSLYYCHYFKDDGVWYEFVGSFYPLLKVFCEDETFNEQTYLRFLKDDDNVNTEWANEKRLIEIRREAIQCQIDEARNEDGVNNLKLITKELAEDCGKIVNFSDDNIPLLLVCAVSSDEDYYYFGMDMDMKPYYESCVGKYHVVNDDTHIEESVTEWYTVNKKKIKNIIDDILENGTDVPFTDYSRLFNKN